MTETIRRMTLKQAAQEFFGDARHASTLRVEIDRGNLVASKIGRAYWTTLPALNDMEAKCRVEAQARVSGGTETEKPGPSSTDDPTIAQGSALRTLSKLKEHFGTTSRESTSRPKVRTRSSPMSSRPTWKPIDTAPKEPEATFLVCAVGDDRGPFVVRADIMWQARKAGTPHHLGLSYLTHWMPLPAMPAR